MNQGKRKPPQPAREPRAARYFANNSSPEKQAAARQRRGQGYDARGWLWQHSSVRRVRDCGRVPIPEDSPRLVKGGDGRAFFGGLVTCGSAGLCPVCAAKVRAGRAEEVEQALGRWRAKTGGDVLFVTFTMRHHAGQRLADLWDGLGYAWGRVTSGKGWSDAKQRHGVAGYVRVVEATHGDNGWHLHIHAALPMTKRLTDSEEKALRSTLFERWVGGLDKHGLTALEGVGVDVRRTYSDSGLGRYMAKAAAELTRGDLKHGGRGGRTPFRILFDLASGTGSTRDAALWAEWEEVSRGRRFISWSRNLRDLVGETASDEELAAVEPDEVEVVAVFTRAAWRRLLSSRGVAGLVLLLDVVETGGAEPARAVLDAWGIRWGPPFRVEMPAA